MVLFERALVSSYRPSIVTFPLSLCVSEILPLLFSSTPPFLIPPLVSPKFPHVSLGVGGWPLGYEERCWANCPCNQFPRFPIYVVLIHQRLRRTDGLRCFTQLQTVTHPSTNPTVRGQESNSRPLDHKFDSLTKPPCCTTLLCPLCSVKRTVINTSYKYSQSSKFCCLFTVIGGIWKCITEHVNNTLTACSTSASVEYMSHNDSCR